MRIWDKAKIVHLHWVIGLIAAFALSACATNPNKPPEPGSKKWYELRLQEIEAAKAEGKLTEEEYLRLKNEADDTRQEYKNASAYNNYPYVGVGIGVSGGHYHHGSSSPPGLSRPSGAGRPR